jgi:hypothetical protein
VKWMLRRRPSPAMIVAMVALFISLSGVSYGVATGFIDSREIKNNEVRSLDIRNNEVRTRDLRNNEVRGIDIRNSTVRGRDVGLNTLTGEDVNEATLGKVPSATSADRADSADSATSAGSAGSVGGITLSRISYAGEIGGPFVEVLNSGGLRLEARCINAGTPALEVRANPAVQNSEISSRFSTFANNDLDFDPGDNTLVVDNPGNTTGQIGYTGSDGRVVTVAAFVRQEANGVRGTTNDCGFFGVAEAG